MSSRFALLAVLALIALIFAPTVVRGRVIYPHDNRIELGDPTKDPAYASLPENRKFSDASAFYVPEIHHHLNGDRSGWLSLWNPHTELGRPASHVSGFSPAFIVTRILSWFTHDAFALYTWLALVTLLLTGVFAFLFLRALGLQPWACFAGAAGLALGVYALYWLTFVMFLSGLCWTLGIAWLTVRFIEQPTLARGFGIAFCVHALLLTAYPQQIVWHAYLLALFSLVYWWRSPRRSVRTLTSLAACVLVGFCLAAPVYADLALSASRSTRLGVDLDFFLPALPQMESLRDVGAFVGQSFDVFQVSNPIAPDDSPKFNGVCLTPFFGALVLVSMLEGGWRRVGLWLGFAGVCLVLTLWPAAYLFGVRHLGLSFSRFVPLAAAVIPLGVVAAISLDRVLREGFQRPWIAITLAAVAPVVSIVLQPGPKSPAWISIHLALMAGFALLVWMRKPWLVALLVVASVALYGLPLVLARPREAIARDSTLVQHVRELTNDGSRYAIVGARTFPLLPPNQEALVGLRSIHTYDSLSSRAFQDWVMRLSSVGAWTFGRRFARIADETRLSGDELSLAGISTLVSADVLSSELLVERGVVGRYRLYKSKVAPVHVAQIEPFDREGPSTSDVLLKRPLARATQRLATVVEENDDHLKVDVESVDRPTLLLVSRQYHPHWQATLTAEAGAASTAPVVIDDFYLGVVIPPSQRSVELDFRPWARWMWLTHTSIAVALLWLVALAWRARRSASATAAATH